MDGDGGGPPCLGAVEGTPPDPAGGFVADLAGARIAGDPDGFTGVVPDAGLDPGPYAGAGGGGMCFPCPACQSVSEESYMCESSGIILSSNMKTTLLEVPCRKMGT